MDASVQSEADRKNRFLLFSICCLAYLAIGFHFSIRSNIAENLRAIFDGIDPLRSSKMVGSALGVPFLGYAITIFFVSPFIDAIGMGRLMKCSGVLIVIGSLMVVAAEVLASSSQLYWVVWGGMLLVGFGWGLVDTNTNPLVVALYPEDKTHKLNVIHAWWPAGIAVGGLMFVMRHFAGTMVHRLSVVGLLWVSCLLAALGLWWLSVAANPASAFLGATFWGVGVCYLWPTMLAAVNERYPRSGALGMGLMGTGATLAIYLFLPVMGRVFDATKIKEAGGEAAFKVLSGEQLEGVLATASQTSFRAVAVLPALLLAVFGVIWLYETNRRRSAR